MSKFAGKRKFLVSNSRKIAVERSKETAKLFRIDDCGRLYLFRHMFLWPKLDTKKNCRIKR